MQRGHSLLFGLQYFVQVYGKTVIAVGPQYTSQDCSNCDNLVKETLSTRTHICGCGAILDRDHNAAGNILARGLKQAGINLNTVGYTEINAWGQTDLYLLVATSTSKSTGPTKNPRTFTRPECQKESILVIWKFTCNAVLAVSSAIRF
jgi:putative transposase